MMSESSVTQSAATSTTFPYEWSDLEQQFMSSGKCVSASLGTGDISTTSRTYSCPYCEFTSVKKTLILYHQVI